MPADLLHQGAVNQAAIEAGIPALEMRGIGKRFPGVLALENVDLTLEPGKVHALMGENGAGKSTLIKIMAGVYGKDAGTMRLQGREVEIKLAAREPEARHQGGVPGDRADRRIHRRRKHLSRRLSDRQGRLDRLEEDPRRCGRSVQAHRLQCRSRRPHRLAAGQPAADGRDRTRAGA